MNDPKENMRCSRCHCEQQQSHFYCNNCGQYLHQLDHDVVSEPSVTSEKLVEQAINTFNKEAHIIELETLEKIQQHATKWAKTNLYFIGVASSVLIFSFSFLGYKKISDLELKIDESSKKVEGLANKAANRIEVLASQVKKKTNAAIIQVDDTLEKATTLKNQIEMIDVKSIQHHLANLGDSIRKADKIRGQVVDERKNVQKLKHSFFSISVHFDGSKKKLNEHWNSLTQVMNNNGFQLNQANLLEIGVNQTEVLYYNEIAKKQADLIASIAKESLALQRMESRMISIFERNPREILLKIKFP